MTDAVAIDFGTSRTKLAYLDSRSQKPELMRMGYQDQAFLPSLFYLPRDSESISWGYDAEEMLEVDPAGIVEVLKRHLHERYVYANRRKVTPLTLLTALFKQLREQTGEEVTAFRGTPPGKAVLAVPALYGPMAEKLLREAAYAAGFGEVELLLEPVAAARAWLLETGETEQDVVVLDCGGGTLDLAYLRCQQGEMRLVPG
ncbi:MAG: Hsp70 family protein [Candidatus Competibacteraceae bacterium]